MKYRIIKIKNDYIPQYRWFFIWFNFYTGYVGDKTIYFTDQHDAERFIEDEIEKEKPVVVSIIKTYNKI